MISFFRKIRQKLLQQNQVTRYLIYALGEIFLVVIGILIALQVNYWNQGRLENIEAEKIEKSIHAEFKQNQVLLQVARSHLQIAFDSNMALHDLVGNDAEMLDKYVLDSLFYFSLEAQDYHPSKNTIDVAIQSGKMKNFKI